MGRLTTEIAAVFADADNLPRGQDLPQISMIDALLPRSLENLGKFVKRKERQPIDPNIARKTYVTYYDVKKRSNGSKEIVAHRSDVSNRKDSGNKDNKNKNKDNKDGNKKGKDNQNQNKGDNNDSNEKPGDREWTSDQDAQLKALKAENKSWKDIAAEMNIAVYLLKYRFKEIENDGDKNNNQNKNSKNKGEKNKSKDQNKQNNKSNDNQKKDKNNNQNKQQSNKHQSKKGDDGDEARFTMNEWITLQEDDMFSFGELQCLSELIMRDQTQTWMRVASAFFDKTGRRVHPEDIREKFEMMAKMS